MGTLSTVHCIHIYRPVSVQTMAAFPSILPSYRRKRKDWYRQLSSSQCPKRAKLKKRKTQSNQAFYAFPSLCYFKTPIWSFKCCLTRTFCYFFKCIYYMSMAALIIILFVAHPHIICLNFWAKKFYTNFFTCLCGNA